MQNLGFGRRFRSGEHFPFKNLTLAFLEACESGLVHCICGTRCQVSEFECPRANTRDIVKFVGVCIGVENSTPFYGVTFMIYELFL